MELIQPQFSERSRRATSGLTWASFVAGVKARLPVDSKRRNFETYLDALIEDGVREMQRYIDAYRQNFKVVVPESGLALTRKAQKFWMPREGLFRGIIVRDAAEGTETQLKRIRFEDHGKLSASTFWDDEDGVATRTEADPGCYAIDPVGDQIFFAPKLAANEVLVLVYDNITSDFQDTDELPWGIDAIRVVYHYVKSEIITETDQDAAQSERQLKDFKKGVRNLFLEEKRKRRAQPSYLPDVDFYDLSDDPTVVRYYDTLTSAELDALSSGEYDVLLGSPETDLFYYDAATSEQLDALTSAQYDILQVN